MFGEASAKKRICCIPSELVSHSGGDVNVLDSLVERSWAGSQSRVGSESSGQGVIGLMQNPNVGATYCPLVMKENQ